MRRLVWLATIGCTPINGPTTPPPPPKPQFRIVAAEPGSIKDSIELRLLDEQGGQGVPLVEPPSGPVVDTDPDWSPDGKWIVFSSSRGRPSAEEKSIWIVSATSDKAAEPRRLTDAQGIDVHPTFAPTSDRIVFQSNRAGGQHLFTMPIIGFNSPAQLTRGAGEADPTWSHDGKHIVFTAIGTRVAIMPADGGAPVELADGMTPVFTPDDKQIIFAAKGDGGFLDLFEMNVDGTNARDLAPSGFGDELEPKLSADGRWLFASSVAMANGQQVYFLIVVADLASPTPSLHAVADMRHVVPRVAVAVSPEKLDAKALGTRPTYSDALKAALGL
jgi:Tol biopolymer transport system component